MKFSSINDKYKTVPVLKKILDKHRKQGKSIVFTNGIFDILHIGHIRYLENAKSMGDLLVVALNTDSSTKRLKGKNRPVLPQMERAEIVSALACVDYVTLFNDETPLKIIKSLHPDILVKGGDYKLHEIVGMKEVKEWGGVVKPIPLIKGYSTTRFIKKIISLKKEL